MSDKKQKIISEYMAELGRKAAEVNKKKGSEYFKWVASHRKDAESGDQEEE